MGIPLYFKTISDKYPEIIKELENVQEINGLFLDLNCAIHPCCRKLANENYKAFKKNQTETRMINEVLNYIDKLVNLINPNLLYIAIDGVAPRAKMAQQRLRRYKSIKERDETNKIKDQLNEPYSKEFWDTNAISPGTVFMEKLALGISNHIKTDISYKSLDVIFSTANVPGEGEHKIFNFIRETNMGGNLVIYGLDADLIMLAMAAKKPNVYLLREAIEFGNKVNMNKFLYLDINELKSALGDEIIEKYMLFESTTINNTQETKDKFIDDYVMMCYLLGNDFLPHLPSVSLRHDGLETLITNYLEIYYLLNQNLVDTDKRKINSQFLNHLIKKIADKEPLELEMMSASRKKFSIRNRKYDSELKRRLDVLNNYPMLNKGQEDYINIGSRDWKKRYYETCFGVTEPEDIERICHNYFEGLKWTFEYYYKECASWNWQYLYRHGPLMEDLSQYFSKLKDINKIELKKATPTNPLIQLLTILPPESNQLIPDSARYLTDDSDSPIAEIYPSDYQLDTIYKRYYWQCVPILPNVNFTKVKKAIDEVKMTGKEKARFKKDKPYYKKRTGEVKAI